MNSKAKPIPDGYHSVTPYILVNDVPKALEFYKRAFGAEELLRLEMKPGQIAHAEFKIGNSVIMISGITPQMKLAPNTGDSRDVCFMLYVNDVDAAAKTAIAAGMKVVKEVQDQFYGDRTGTFEDPFGNVWSIGTHIEDVSTEETTNCMQKLYGDKS
ncbi:MAG: VOC family protein [Bacteriovorax sp.]|nr:VOC family protein [Bacteriovorax sp.]